MSSYLGKFKYCSNGVELPKRRIVKAIRRIHREPQSSTQFDSITLFRNSVPSKDIVKSSESNSETIVHLEGFSEINLEESKPKVNFRNALPSTNIVTSSEPNGKTIVHLEGFSEINLEESKPKVNFRNSLPSTNIVTSSEPNGKTIVHLEGFSEIKLEDFNPKANFQNSLPSTNIVTSSEPNSKTIVHLERFSEIKLEDSKPKVNLNENISNILYIEKPLFSNFFSAHSNIFHWNSSCTTLKKVVEIHNGKRFVRMEYVTGSNYENIPEQYYPKVCMDDVDFEHSKNNLISEYDYQTGARHSSCNSIRQDKIHTNRKDLVSPNSINNSRFLNSENGAESNRHLPSQSINSLSKFISNVKVPRNKMYQICFVLKDEPISYFLESASEECKHDTEFVFDTDTSISYPVTDEKVEIYDQLNVEDCRKINFNGKILQAEVPESPKDAWGMKASIYDNIQKSKKIWASAPEEFQHEAEFVFDIEPLPYPVADEKVNIYEKSNVVVKGRGINFDHKISQIKVSESPTEVCEMMTTIYDEIQNCKKMLDSLEETTELIKKELFLPSLCHDVDVTECVSTPELHMEEDFKQREVFDSYVNKSFEEKESILLDNSLGILYSEHKMNELAKTLGSQTSTFVEAKNYESLERLDTIDEENKDFAAQFRHFSSSRENSQDNYVDFHCKLSKLRNVSEEELLTWPSVSALSLLDSILLSLQITYEIVEKEVHSWLSFSGPDQSDSHIQGVENETNCQSVKTLVNQHDCFTNNNYILKFKGRNTDTTEEKSYEWVSSSSDSDALTLPEEKEPESDLDDSESSLDGSFKQHRTGSRASTISSDDDFDDIPRFSLPSRISNTPKFNTKKTELFDEVSRKEWSWKNAETEISWKCTRKGRRFRSEEQGGLGIPPKDFLKEDLGIPEDLLRDFHRVTSLSENATQVEHEVHIDKYSS